MAPKIELDVLKQRTPFDTFDNEQVLVDVLRKGEALAFAEGNIIFKRGDSDAFSYWLISGTLDLLDQNFDVSVLKDSDAMATQALDDQVPHTVTAISTSNSVIFRLKRSYLDLVAKLQASDHYMVSSLEEVAQTESDWMASMLSSPLFDFVPPSNIQQLFTRFEEVECQKGEAVIRQGEPGDYFYVLKSGSAQVDYNTGSRNIVLAELEAGAFFGEDALISNVPRNATITMLSDGALMRLSEDDFRSLLQAPLIERLEMSEVQKMIAEADPLTWILDVRTKFEYQADMMEDSINVPLLSLRKDLGKLDTDSVYVARSGGDKRAELAAYILNGNGYTAYVLNEPAS